MPMAMSLVRRGTHWRQAAWLCAFIATPLSLGSAEARDAHVPLVRAFVEERVTWISDPLIIQAIRQQNEDYADLTQAEIDALDLEWRAGFEGGDRSLIETVLARPVSDLLRDKQADSGGTIVEILLMDNKGLNVGLSEMSSDYWQGDEDKFQKSYGAGGGAVFVDGIEKDDSTQSLQSQVSLTISDDAGVPIGAIMVGVNLDAL